MSAQIYWHSPNKVLYLEFTGVLKPETLLAGTQHAATLLNNCSGTVHVIINMTRTGSITKNTTQLRNLLAPLTTHNNLGWTVVMTGNILLQSYLNRAAYRMTSRWGYVNSFSEAVKFLRQMDKSLPNVSISRAENPQNVHKIR